MPEARSPFEEDTAAHQLADRFGFRMVRRYRAIDVFDQRALAAAGYTAVKESPDFALISRALDEGLEVPGAGWRCTEYILRPRGTKS